ncbi:MAG: hypothetical protein LBG74_03720 [Spirochaetaceae bacterium]|jgi:outer membrane protein assembly factor BamD (BamD/ComL family)|nr:hypothetical protein [Spirochaetaceae bacterium]
MWKFIVWGCFFSVVAAGCMSRPEIPQTASVMEIVQKAQTATDRDRYNLAIYYYSAIQERFPFDAAALCLAQYEIAHIHYKQKKYSLAKSELEELLLRYEQRGSALLPQEYKTLGNIVLKKIAQKIKQINLVS